MKKIDKNYCFTQKELEATQALYTLGRYDWLTSDVLDALSTRSDRRVNRQLTMDIFAHRKRVIGKFPQNAGKYLLELNTRSASTKP